ncbi:restriction endonuclease subunit S [Streptomyces sp. TRM66268-LWL]|uniref:Restriction endonuclease subunit S n=1 Tax=Streptomyces polyasparticus TaxID=2767826 RepID=A0ABR7SWY3_9ACTN|nr:restriction endonuclease subunit S [Streptomyces polyasparticus]MBC9719399.1 restriction endonuclease subunit S [Streptomyces polyasparticus]
MTATAVEAGGTGGGAAGVVDSGNDAELPKGWARATLGEIISPISERYKPTPGDDLPYLGMDHVESHTGRILDLGTAATIKSSSPVVKPGYLLYGRLRPYLNKVALADFSGICSGEFIAFPPSSAIDSRFLQHRLLSPDFVHYVMQKNPTGDRPRAHWEQFSDFTILLPPLAEQHRIVAKLDEQLAHVEAGQSALSATANKMEELIQATLQEAFRGTLTTEDLSEGGSEAALAGNTVTTEGMWSIPKEWQWTTIGSLFQVFVGSTPSRSVQAYWGGNIPWVSSGEVAFGRISTTRESITMESITNPETRIHPPGTVMVAMIGEGKTRGQTAILDIPAAHNQNCASIRVSETRILPEYVYYFFMSRYEETRREASGGNQPALNKGKIQALKIPIPPVGTQRAIVSRIQAVERELLDLRGTLDASRSQASNLRAAVCHTAFSGQLVPQLPTDEPASALLDRIRAERAASARTGKRRHTSRTSKPTGNTGQGELPL